IEKFCKEKENARYSSSPQKTKPFVEALLSLTDEIIDTYNAKKKRKVQMDFSDITRAAVAILKDEKAQKEIAQKYQYLFVDEFQDINPLQDELFSSIKAKRFFVGDIKQSIYAFRLSDPKIFQEHIKRVETEENAKSTFIELNHNFRSCEGILKFCDAVFSSLLTPDFGGIAYKNFQASKGNALAAPVLCHHLVLEKDEKEETVGEENGDEFFFSESPVIPPIYSVKNNKNEKESLSAEEAEIKWIASHITNLKQQEITINGRTRAVTGSDITVLLRSGGKHAVLLAAELQKKGISAKYFNEQDPFENAAICALVSFLKLLDNRRDDILLAGVLKSRFGDFCTDEDLIEIRRFAILDKEKPLSFNQAVWLYSKKEKANKVLADKISALETALNHYEKVLFALGASNLAGKISADYDLFKYAIIHDGAFALSQFLDALCGIDKGFSLKEMLNAIDTNAIKIGSGAVENDSVQIMTMHAAKGLEFPFVVLANLTKRFNLSDLYGQVLLDSDLGAAIKLYDRDENILLETSLWHLMRLEKSKKMLEEELRLLYVALTRGIFQTALFARMADDYNPLPPFLAKSMMDFLYPHFIQKAARKRIEDFALEDKKPPVITHITEPADHEIFEAIKERVNFVYPHSSSPVKLTATKIAQKGDSEEEIVPLADFVPKESQDKKGIETGNAYHRFLETVDFSVGAISALQSFKGLYPQEYSLLNSKTATRCYDDIAKKTKGKKFYREIPFMYKDENGILIQGIIDLLILYDTAKQKTLEIIDYKTGNPSNELLTAYQKQLDIYADIAAQILSTPTTKKYIYAINNGKFYDF
ncbi:MAG: UvrD-helicase domain-containing protein, partial [Firmicutes bacterium]|nr:UvrD-helicase domain-containing protein [Bacillota bacterium]